MRHILSYALLIAFIIAGRVDASAQSDDFKAEWKQMVGTLYGSAKSFDQKSKNISGATTFQVFGINGKLDFPASFKIEGDVIRGAETNKIWLVQMKTAVIEIKNTMYEIEFQGTATFSAEKDKNTSNVNINITFVDGMLTYNGEKYHVADKWHDNIGTLLVSYPEKSKTIPAANIDVSKMNLPSKNYHKAEPSNEVIDGIASGKIELLPEDKDFMQMVAAEDSYIKFIPEYEEYLLEVRDINNKDNIVATEVIGHKIGNEIQFRDMTAIRSDDGRYVTVNTTYGYNGWDYSCTAKYDTNERDPKFTSIVWNEVAKYDNDNDETLTRLDGSKLYTVHFNPDQRSKYINKKGYIPLMLKALQEVIKPETYDFKEYYDKYGLEIFSYSDSGSTERVPIANNIITPIAEREYKRQIEEQRSREEAEANSRMAREEFQKQQANLEKEYKGENISITKHTFKTTGSPKYQNVQLKKTIHRNDQGIYEANYVVNSKGKDYQLQFDGDDYFFTAPDGKGTADVTLAVPDSLKEELALWWKLKENQ